MTDNIEKDTTPIELEEVIDTIEQLDLEETVTQDSSAGIKADNAADAAEETMEIVDIDVVKPNEVDLKLEDEPFEIGMDTVRKKEEEQAKAAAEISGNSDGETSSDKNDKSKSSQKDVMLKDLDDIIDSLKASAAKKIILIMALISLIGSFFIFCSIHVGDIPAMPIGNFFNGYSGNIISNIISKISIIAIIASAVCATVNLKKFSIYAILISLLTFIGQCVFFVLWGSMDYAVPLTVFRPGLGFFITLVPLIIMFFAVLGNKTKPKA